jgi:hypothetical protein
LTKETPIEYNGLLYSPTPLAPGQSARGLMFFKSRVGDLAALRLAAALAPPLPQ